MSNYAAATAMGAGAQMVQGIAGAYSNYQLGKIAGYRARYMGVIAKIQIGHTKAVTQVKKERRQLKFSQDVANYLSNVGASGFDISSNSTHDVVRSLAFSERMDEAAFNDERDARIWSLEVGASNALAGAKTEEQASRMKSIGSLVTAGQGMTQTMGNYYMYKKH